MNDLTTAREALLAEALGQVGALLDRLEGLELSLNTSRDAIVQASDAAAAELKAFHTGMSAVSKQVQAVAVRHIARRTEELARRTSEAQVRAMKSAALDLFSEELQPVLNGLARSIQQLQPYPTRLERLLTHAAVAALSSALGWVAATVLWAG